MKLIDADALIEKIEKRIEKIDYSINPCTSKYNRVWAYNDVIELINSMQEESSKVDYGKIKSELDNALKKETKEPVSEDLEGEINRYLSTWKTSKDNGIVFCEKMARHFFELGKNHKEPISEDLEEEIERWVYNPYFDLDGVAVKGATHYLTVEDVADIARQFAEWGKETMRKQYAFINLQDAKEAYHEWLKTQDIPHAGVAWIRACQWQKEQIMKDAITAKILPTNLEETEFCLDDYDEVKHITTLVKKGNLKIGDKVKVILVKEE